MKVLAGASQGERIKAYLRVCINTHSSGAGGNHKCKRPKNGDVSKSPRACEKKNKSFGMKTSTRATCCGANKQARLAYTRRTVHTVLQHLHHTYIHHGTHSHAHTRVTCEIHAHAHAAATVYYDPLQLTISIHKAKDKAHRAHGQNKIKK